jgi:type VI secretion system protein ImpC
MPGEKRAEVFLDVEPQAGTRRWEARPDPELPFRILVLADLYGARPDRKPLADRVPIRIDRDDFDAVLERAGPVIDLRLDGSDHARVALRIRDIDDFHPDSLYRDLPVFAGLREMRRRLENPATFPQAARELMGEPEAAATPRPAPGSILDSILGETDGGHGPVTGGAIESRPADSLQRFIRSVMAAHLVPGEDPRQAALLERADRAVAPMMRAVLRDPAFRAVEALWRAIHRLVRRVETDSSLGIWLFDVTREELSADIGNAPSLEQSALYRAVVEREAKTPGGVPWSLLVGDFRFGPAASDVRLLEGLAALGHATDAPFVAAASPRLAGAAGFEGEADPASWEAVTAPEWAAFRRGPLARWAGLVLPRVLQRLPYGEENEPCDAFDFEEVDAPPRHEDLLWGNPAFPCAILLARSFSRAGWQLRSGFDPDLSGLPLHLYRDAGEARSQPCGETLLTERAAIRLLELGLMPLASIRDQDAVRLVRLQSVADPPTPLAARW